MHNVLLKYGHILQYLFKYSESLNEWNASFKSNTERTSQLELLRTENVSLTKGYTKLFIAIPSV